MADKNSNNSTGVGVTGLLQVAFIVLKLCKVIDWSWWWVLAPLWITLIFVAILFAIQFAILKARK